jgi:hypothetical protein
LSKLANVLDRKRRFCRQIIAARDGPDRVGAKRRPPALRQMTNSATTTQRPNLDAKKFSDIASGARVPSQGIIHLILRELRYSR